MLPYSSATEIPVLPTGVRLITLDNGLTLILREDHSAPVVSAQAWCRAGSIDEGKWLGAGLSHVLEHMLFKGTTRRGPGRIDQEVQEAGGYMNAYTSFDRTVYHINVPNTGATVAVDILCDIMQNATLPEDELEKEKQVILREMDMNQDDPGRRSSRRLFETAFSRSPYRYTIIGYPDIFNEVRRDDVLAYYREKYASNNLVFVVVGDIQAEIVETQIRQAFAGVKAKPQPSVVLPDEPKQAAPRETVEEAPVELGHFHIAWHIPDSRHEDIPPLDVLATLLGAGHSSRLYQEVREKKAVVHSADAWTYNPGNTGLLGLSAVADGAKFGLAREALLAEVERMKREPVSAAELSKAVKQFISATFATRKTMQGQAQDLGGNWLAANDLNFSERYLAAVKRVRPEDLQRVAQKYLTTENRTLFALLPTGSVAKPPLAPTSSWENAIRKFVLPNGLRLLLKEDHRLPFVQFRTVFQGGVQAENSTQNGLTALLAKLFLKGTTTRSAEQLVTEIESLGGSLDTYGGNNSFGITAEVLSDDFAHGLELVADVLLRPQFASSALDREKLVQLAAIKAQKDQLLQSASRLMRLNLFGTQGYGLDVNGTEESVAGLQIPDLQRFYDRWASPHNGVLAIYGDIQIDVVKEAVEKQFLHWHADPPVPPIQTPPPPLVSRRHICETREKKQAVVVIGFPGVTLHHPDRYPLELLQEALSDLGSRLFKRIREDLGLAYYVGAQNFLGTQPGYFAFYAGTAPDKVEQVVLELLEEAHSLCREGLTEAELKRAKAKQIGQRKIARQDLGGYAMTTALDELYGLGFANCDSEDAHYESVTLVQTRTVAQRYLNPEACVVAVVKPAP